MNKKLSPKNLAYNATVEALNLEDQALIRRLEARQRLWDAAEALAPLGGHGKSMRTRDAFSGPPKR